jgi:hypothetical protein
VEHHRGERRATDVAVKFFTRPTTAGTGRVINISTTGAFLETRLPLRLLSLLYLEPTDRLPADSPYGRIAATVVRCTAIGVGLEWCEFAAQTTRVFARLAAGSSDIALEHQLLLPGMTDALHLPHRASRPRELPGLCRLEFLD